VEREKAHHLVAMLCRVLRVSTSGHHAWRKRKPAACTREDGELTKRIGQIHLGSRGTYSELGRLPAEQYEWLTAHTASCPEFVDQVEMAIEIVLSRAEVMQTIK
jgi:hypothetical protein